MDSHLPLVEPFSAPDIFISGIADAEDIGDGMIRLVCYAKRKNPHDCSTERVIVLNIVLSKETLVRNMFTCAKQADVSVVADVEMLPRGEVVLN